MERVWVVRISIRESEIDCNRQANITTSKYIIEESVSLLEFQIG
jgi:hypothetical protein